MHMLTEVLLIHFIVNVFLFGVVSQQLYAYSLSGSFTIGEMMPEMPYTVVGFKDSMRIKWVSQLSSSF